MPSDPFRRPVSAPTPPIHRPAPVHPAPPHEPKLPVQLPSQPPPGPEPSLHLESAAVNHLEWAAADAARVTFDTLHLNAPDLTSARLREASWTDIAVVDGQLAGLDATGGSWRRVVASGIRASGLILAEAKLRDVGLSASKLDLVNLRFAQLSRVAFVDCYLHQADFGGATLTDVCFAGSDLTGADFSGASLTRVDFRGAHLEGISGLSGLRGGMLSAQQIIALAPELAHNLGIIASP